MRQLLWIALLILAAGHSPSKAQEISGSYGCRFYMDHYIYSEFYINEIDFQWDEQAELSTAWGGPYRVKVLAEESRRAGEEVRFTVPGADIKIVVYDTIKLINAKIFDGLMDPDGVSGACYLGETREDVTKWFNDQQGRRRF